MIVLLTGVALVAGACAGGDEPGKAVASVAGSPSATAPAASGKGDPVAFAKCVRENGVPDFKDPERGKPMGDGIDIKSEAFKKAQDACKEYQPTGDPGLQGPNSGQVWSTADKLKYAQCMRDNGVPSFPDPDANGGFAMMEGSGADPTSPQFKKAEDVCKKYQPESIRNMAPNAPGGPGSGS
jgi:hypothetical protein